MKSNAKKPGISNAGLLASPVTSELPESANLIFAMATRHPGKLSGDFGQWQ